MSWDYIASRIGIGATRILAGLMLVTVSGGLLGFLWWWWVTGATVDINARGGEILISPEGEPIRFAIVVTVVGISAVVIGALGVVGLHRVLRADGR